MAAVGAASALLVATAFAPGSLGATRAAPDTAALNMVTPGFTFASEVRLAGRAVVDRWTSRTTDVVVAAVAGSQVRVDVAYSAPRTSKSGTGSVGVAVTPPSERGTKARTTSSVSQAQELTAMGLSPAAIAKIDSSPSPTTTGPTPRQPPVCVEVDGDKDSNGRARQIGTGCEEQYLDSTDPSNSAQWYLVDRFHGSGVNNDPALIEPDHLTQLDVNVRYNWYENEIADWDPQYDYPVNDGQCTTETTGAHLGTASGVSAEYSQAATICPNRLGPDNLRSYASSGNVEFGSAWYGYDKDFDQYEATIGNDYVSNGPGGDPSVTNYTHIKWCWGCSGS
jgi:hypothetical protein